jgi:hypothetical protein
LLCVLFTAVALVTYFGRSWQVGAALSALVAILVAVIRFVGYFGSSVAGIGQFRMDDPAALRAAVPAALARMAMPEPPEQLPAILAEFGAQAGLLAVRILNPNNNVKLKQWGWEAIPQDAEKLEAPCASFDITDERGPLQLQFFVDSASGTVSPKAYVLLQLVADAAAAMLMADRKAPRAAPSIPEGRLA